MSCFFLAKSHFPSVWGPWVRFVTSVLSHPVRSFFPRPSVGFWIRLQREQSESGGAEDGCGGLDGGGGG